MESYSHIELTDDEVLEALIWRKRRKEDELKKETLRLREEQNRKRLTQSTTYDIVRSLMLHRSEVKFEGKFKLDEKNSFIFDLLCRYFGHDGEFIPLAKSIGIENPTLEKGILLAGSFGAGKTWFMQLFQMNQRQVFSVKNCKLIAEEYMTIGEEGMEQYTIITKNAADDPSVFYQKYSGLCLDDIGTEEIKTHYGNKKNVIGDLIENRYTKKATGIYLHGTTNLTAEQLKEFYGNRITSRMREIFNFIELKGSDRRK